MSDDSSFNEKVIEEFRANDGNVGGPFQGSPMILVNAKGAKTGIVRTIPLVYTRDGDNFVIIASNGGAHEHPDWYYNLKANPTAVIEVGAEKMVAEAHEALGAERDRLFDAQAKLMPGFADYQAKTERTIPVLVLVPEKSNN